MITIRAAQLFHRPFLRIPMMKTQANARGLRPSPIVQVAGLVPDRKIRFDVTF
jgi:hypothetical protein